MSTHLFRSALSPDDDFDLRDFLIGAFYNNFNARTPFEQKLKL